jgi:hypothetical protein
MRVMVHEYAQGGRTAFQVSDDGDDLIGYWEGQRQVGQRICAFIDVGCDSTDRGVERLLESLSWLMEEIRQRKGQVVSAAANGPAVAGG